MFCSFSYWKGKWLACLAQPDGFCSLLYTSSQCSFFMKFLFVWFQMFHGNQSNQWHQDDKASQPEKWEGPWEEEPCSQSTRILTPQEINGLWMALCLSHMTPVLPTVWMEIVRKIPLNSLEWQVWMFCWNIHVNIIILVDMSLSVSQVLILEVA